MCCRLPMRRRISSYIVNNILQSLQIIEWKPSICLSLSSSSLEVHDSEKGSFYYAPPLNCDVTYSRGMCMKMTESTRPLTISSIHLSSYLLNVLLSPTLKPDKTIEYTKSSGAHFSSAHVVLFWNWVD